MPRRTIWSGARPAHSTPSNCTEPAIGRTSPISVLSNVVLPDPFPPNSATIDRVGTWNETSRRTSVIPYATLRCLMSSTEVLSKVSLDDTAIVTYRERSSIRNSPPRTEHRHLIADIHHQSNGMLDENERHSL